MQRETASAEGVYEPFNSNFLGQDLFQYVTSSVTLADIRSIDFRRFVSTQTTVQNNQNNVRVSFGRRTI